MRPGIPASILCFPVLSSLLTCLLAPSFSPRGSAFGMRHGSTVLMLFLATTVVVVLSGAARGQDGNVSFESVSAESVSGESAPRVSPAENLTEDSGAAADFGFVSGDAALVGHGCASDCGSG